MRRVIDKRVYDTDTAELVHCWDNNLGDSDINQCEETLYRTPNGRWFVWGRGGANTRWNEQIETNHWAAGEGLRALGPDEALLWLEDHNVPAETVERYFKVKAA
jgi:hypothetical protein